MNELTNANREVATPQTAPTRPPASLVNYHQRGADHVRMAAGQDNFLGGTRRQSLAPPSSQAQKKLRACKEL
jgi:hypothetical protein